MPHKLQWKKYNGPEKGVWTQFDSVPVKNDEIKIDVKAAGVNYADILMVKGQYQDAPKPPATPGYEVAGTVIEAGPDSGFQKGQRVVSLTPFGGYATELNVRGVLAAPIGDGISFADAASVPVTGLTALVALEKMARIGKDDTVLIHSASGGVGQMAIQLCQIAGASPIGIVSRESKKEYLEQKFPGIKVVVDAGEDQYGEKLKAEGITVDVSLNAVGGNTVVVDRDLLGIFGKLIIFGIARATGKGLFGLLGTIKPMLFSNPLGAMKKNMGYFGLNLLNLMGTEQEKIVRPNLTQFMQYLNDGKIKSMVEKEFPMQEAAVAHKMLTDRKAVGKLILTNP